MVTRHGKGHAMTKRTVLSGAAIGAALAAAPAQGDADTILKSLLSDTGEATDIETNAENIGELTIDRKDAITREFVQLALEVLGGPEVPRDILLDSVSSWNALVEDRPECANDEVAFQIHQGAFIGGATMALQWIARHPEASVSVKAENPDSDQAPNPDPVVFN